LIQHGLGGFLEGSRKRRDDSTASLGDRRDGISSPVGLR